MSEKDKSFAFLEGLKSWVRTEIMRQPLKTIYDAMNAVGTMPIDSDDGDDDGRKMSNRNKIDKN